MKASAMARMGESRMHLWTLLCGATLILGGRSGAAEPRLPFTLPTAADAARCMAAREKAMEAIRAKDWPAAETNLRSAIAAFPDSQIDWYNLGCVLARQGESKAALDALQRSADAGAVFISAVSHDPDLDSLRRLPAYQSWLRSISVVARAERLASTAPLGRSRDEIETQVHAAKERIRPYEELLGPQQAVADASLQRWKADSLLALADGMAESPDACHARWEALQALLDDRRRPASECVAGDVVRLTSRPSMACMQHWVEVLHAEAQARYFAAMLDAEDEAGSGVAQARLRSDLLAIAAAAGDEPALESLLMQAATLSTDDLPLATRLYRRLIALAADRVTARSGMARSAPGIVLAAEGMPDFEAIATDGRTVSNATIKGKWTLLDVWGTWCGPCIEDLPDLKAIHATHSGHGMEFVGVAVEYEERSKREAFLSWCADHGVTWPQVLDIKPEPGTLAETFGVSVIPYYVLIDPTGRVAAAGPRVAALKGAIDRAFPAPTNSAAPR